MNKYHYVYRITNTKLNKHYYGTRSSNIEPSKDLGVKYFSSTSDKEFRDDQKNNPQDYKYVIVSVFNSREDALKLEIKLHNRFNVGFNESFYNRAKQTSTFYNKEGIPLSDEHRAKMSRKLKGRVFSKQTLEKMRLGQLGNKLSEETKAKIKKKQLEFNYKPSEEFKEYLRELNTGVNVYHDPNTKENRRFNNIDEVPKGWIKGQSIVKTAKCIHCNKIGNKAAMFRWHFDNCKKKQ
jgi:hypothetical protein